MKKITIVLFAIFSISQIMGQEKFSGNLDEIRQKVHNTDPKDNILEALDLDIYDFEEDDEVTYEEEFELKNENDILNMFRDIIEAREDREIPSSVWDNLNVGDLLGGSINADGSINIDGYVGNIPMPGGDFNLDIGNPNGEGKNRSYAGSGYGQNKGSGVGDINNPTGGIGNDGFRGVPGRGHHSSGGHTWSVEATHSSSKHSDGNSTTTFIHHTSSVSNDTGYHSETDKQHYNNGDGTWVTKTHVSQTQADGSNATCDKTVTKDEDGTVTTTTTVTKTDADGNETSKKTTEKEEKTSGDPREEFEGGNPPPGPIEKAMAVFRAVTLNSLAGGNHNGDANDPRGEATQNSNGNGMINVNDGSTLGNLKPKTKGGKVNVNKVLIKQQVTNPGKKN